MKHRVSPHLVLAVLATAVSAPYTSAITDVEAATGRALAKQFADTVVSVEVVATVKVTVADHAQPPRENKIEANGTVLSSTGLTVTVLSAIDPHGAMEAMISARGMGGQKIEIGETEFKDVKLRLADNTEIPAVIVLKDPDLNLVFVAPLPGAKGPPRTFPFVSLDKAATGEVLANYYLVQRAGKSMQRVPLVRQTTIVGIVEKPRRMFLLSELAPGVPIFDPAGLVLGISTPYLENGRPVRDIVLTASDVAELATQAAAVKPEEKQESAGAVDNPAPPADQPPGKPADAPAKQDDAPAKSPPKT
jgi:hypothetical protein